MNGDDTDGEDRIMLMPEDYVVEPIEAGDSDQEEYIAYEMDTSRRGEDTIEILEDTHIDSGEYEVVRRDDSRKRHIEHIQLDSQPMLKRTAHDNSNSLVEFQKKLMQLEYEEMRKLRAEKHALEIAILKADLAHKTMEHQKRMEVLSKKASSS